MWFYIVFIILNNAAATQNKTSRGVKMSYGSSQDMKALMYEQKIIKDVYVRDGYDPNDSPSQLACVSYEIADFDVDNMDEIKKQLTLQLKMRATWFDPRIEANFTGANNNIILLPSVKSESLPLIWTPYQNLVIKNWIKWINVNHPRNYRFLKFYTTNSWSFGRFPPNSALVSASINWRVVLSCYKWLKYLNFPHDSNRCKFEMRSEYANATFDVNVRKTRERFFQTYVLSGFAFSNSIMPPIVKNTSGYEFGYTQFGVDITFERLIEKYVYEYYMPCILIVLASMLSFIIPLSAIPGRVALVVTQFLTLTNMFIHQRVIHKLIYITLRLCHVWQKLHL